MEEADSVFTRERTDTPTNVRDVASTGNAEGAVVTFSRHDTAWEAEAEQGADYGDSDGEDMRWLARPKHTSALSMRHPRIALATGMSLEDKRQRKAAPERKTREDETSPRLRKNDERRFSRSSIGVMIKLASGNGVRKGYSENAPSMR